MNNKWIGGSLICLTFVLLIFSKNQIAGSKKEKLADGALKKSLSTGTTEGAQSVSLLQVLKSNLAQSRKGRNDVGDPETVRIEGIYAGQSKDNQALEKRNFSEYELKLAQLYFKNLIKYKKPLKLYNDSASIFGQTKHGLAAARWITLGLVFDSSASFEYAHSLALKDLNEDSRGVGDTLISKAESFRKDPFLYQMAMNLANTSAISKEVKIEYFGREIEYQLRNFKSSSDNSFWISVMGLRLAQQSGVTASDIVPFINRGLSSTKADEQIKNEVKRTVATYFPGYSG